MVQIKTIKPIFLIAIIATLSMMSFLSPIRDHDFWWHLETGRWIWDNRSLPEADPFSYTSTPPGATTLRERTILKSSWLADLTLFLGYNLKGYQGIIILRALVFLIALLSIAYYLHTKDVRELYILFGVVLALLFFKEFTNTRPKMFSYAFTVILLLLCEQFKKTKKVVTGSLIGIVMLLWANSHRGYLLGIAILVVYALAGWIRVKKGTLSSKIALVFSVSPLVCLINPLGIDSMIQYFNFYGTVLQKESFEFQSPLSMYQYLGPEWSIYLTLAIVSLWVLITRSGHLPLEHRIIIVLLLGASLLSMRFAVYFVVTSLMFLIPLLQELSFRHLKGLVGLVTVVAISIALYSLPDIGYAYKNGYDKGLFPERSVKFIKEKHLSGPIFNDVLWGGYMIHELYPEYKVFVDTRTLNPRVYEQYMAIVNGDSSSFFEMPLWRAILQSYSFRTFIHAAVNPYDCKEFPIVQYLLQDPGWKFVYADGQAVIFVRFGAEDLQELPPEYLRRQVIIESRKCR